MHKVCMKFIEMKKECEEAGIVKEQEGVEVCGLSLGVRCCGYSCPSKLYWSAGHRQHGYHKNRALERTGLVKQFKEEMNEPVG